MKKRKTLQITLITWRHGAPNPGRIVVIPQPVIGKLNAEGKLKILVSKTIYWNPSNEQFDYGQKNEESLSLIDGKREDHDRIACYR